MRHCDKCDRAINGDNYSVVGCHVWCAWCIEQRATAGVFDEAGFCVCHFCGKEDRLFAEGPYSVCLDCVISCSIGDDDGQTEK